MNNNNSSDSSSFSFHNNKRHSQSKIPSPPHKKPKRNTIKKAVLHFKTLQQLPLISRSTDQICDSICLEPYKPYSIGRNRKLCDFIFADRRVSKVHCQLLFDSLNNKIYLSDGLFSDCSNVIDSFLPSRVSLKGVFVNGVRICGVVGLCVGDVVCLVCGNGEECSTSVGFLVEKIVFAEEVDSGSLVQFNSCSVRSERNRFSLRRCGVVNNSSVLLNWCRDILCNADPVSYIRNCVVTDRNKQSSALKFDFQKGFELFLSNGELSLSSGHQIECRNRKRVYSRDVEVVECNGNSSKEVIVVSTENIDLKCPNFLSAANADVEKQMDGVGTNIEYNDTVNGICAGLTSEKQEYAQLREVVECNGNSSKETIVVSDEKTDLMYDTDMDKQMDGVATDCNDTVNGICAGLSSEKQEYAQLREVVECDGNSSKETIVVSGENTDLKYPADTDMDKQMDGVGTDIANGICAGLSLEKQDYPQFREVLEDKSFGGCTLPPGKKFYLNRLQFRDEELEEMNDVVSLPELFHPADSLKRVFIATFTSDIAWFLSYCKIPPHLPVTIACHNSQRCWSADPDDRISLPFPDFPKLTVVHPLFPEVIAFNKDRKNSGIGCHHPKLIVLQREDSLRVVITSANLVAKQWHNVTNTVWWQDFPRLSTPNGFSLFTQLSVGEISKDSKCDFAAQLAGFMASLVADVPTQAHWILELIKYDFRGAAGYLVASVPGIHSHRRPAVSESRNFLVCNEYKLEFSDAKLMASVEASVVGLSHIYRASADSSGAQLKKLALILGKCRENVDGMSEIVLRRDTNIPADRNAVSVLIQDTQDFSMGDYVQLGFLPKHVAKWVAPLSDTGLFAFSAYIYPKEVLATALEGNSNKVKLVLYVYAGPSFSDISEVTQPQYVSAVCSLVASSQRYAGLWRLEEVLAQYKWPEHLETEFFFGSSSVGSVNAQFLAAFSAAAGKRAVPFSDSEESDPDWGCWSASHELKNPSLGILFPSIERVKNSSGIMTSRTILCFSEETWQRLKNVGILHDAVPYSRERFGFPMHVKVGRRRFRSKKDGSSFGWVYSGSHNFSAAAWGRPMSDVQSNRNTRNTSVLGSRLHISNYELGIIFVVPPPSAVESVNQSIENLDDIVLPFVVPPPKYKPSDKPATKLALRVAVNELMDRERKIYETGLMNELMEEEMPEEEEDEVVGAAEFAAHEKEDEKAYADVLWSQVDSSESH